MPSTGKKGRFGLGLLWLPFLLFLLCQLTLQVANRSYTSEFARTYDEAGHYVSGLMVRDFIASLEWSRPMAFAEEYYLHYPKVAIGHWPPVFHLLQALWMLLFGASRASLMLLMALLAAALSLSVHRILEPEYGFWAGLAGGLLLALLPLVQMSSCVVMAEIPLALTALWAALAFGRYLDTERPSWLVWWALAATLAIMTKPSGLALAVLPLFCLLLTGRLRLLRRWPLWASALGVAAICGPWYFYTLPMLRNGPLASSPQWGYTVRAIPEFTLHLVQAFGFALCAFAVVGIVVRLALPAVRHRLAGKWVALGSLALAALAFHWVIPADFDPRHIVFALPPMICFCVAGIAEVARRLSRPRRLAGARTALVVGLAVGLFGVQTFTLPGSEWRGCGAVADELLALQAARPLVVLVSADPMTEGALVAEVAMRDRRRQLFVLRSSKVLAYSRWDGGGYRSLFATPEELRSYLDEVPIDLVVLDRSVDRRFLRPHYGLVWRAVTEDGEGWNRVASYDMTRNGWSREEVTHLYARAEALESWSPGKIRIDLTEMLGRYIEAPLPPPPPEPR